MHKMFNILYFLEFLFDFRYRYLNFVLFPFNFPKTLNALGGAMDYLNKLTGFLKAFEEVGRVIAQQAVREFCRQNVATLFPATAGAVSFSAEQKPLLKARTRIN